SNITAIANELQHLLHVQFINSDVYFINYLPSQIKLGDIIEVCLASMGFSLLATIYPAIIAFKTEPAEALRYE
ncbi:MAG: lipoprotein-releasing system transmembrane subunit LolC, partial [Gammaproteobacteria bacterium]|nr:lipoprotein-releasing system transmembrane subunit LolC [Gammaproteobacteria bacterium]